MSMKASARALVPFVSVDNMMRLVHHIGIEQFLADLSAEIETDFVFRVDFECSQRLFQF